MKPYVPPPFADVLEKLDAGELREMVREQNRDIFELKERVRELEREQESAAEQAYTLGYMTGRASKARPAAWGGDSPDW